jgi:DNA-binding CsgD family transcriptional regulator
MARLLPFFQLIVVACALVFFGAWGALPARVVLAPLLVAALCPVFAAAAVWPPAALVRALRDGWGSDPLRRTRPGSVDVWRFLERLAPVAGALGVLMFAVMAVAGLPGSGDPAAARRRAIAMAGLCGAEAAGAFLLFRAVRQTVDLLRDRTGAPIPREISDAAVRQFGLSPREREVAALLTEGMRYEEIAERLFISVTTVKTHVHRLYEKADCRNRMELANRLRA